MAFESVLGGIALDTTVQAVDASIDAVNASVQNLQTSQQATTQAVVDNSALAAQIAALNDTMLYFCAAVLDKMARLSRTDALVVDLSETGLVGASINQVINANSNVSTGQIFYRTNEVFQFSNSGSAYLYNQITVS